MDIVYYDGQELRKRILEFLDWNRDDIEIVEFKPFIPNPDLETYKSKYRLLYGKEFEDFEIEDTKKLVIRVMSNDNRVHLRGSLEYLFYGLINLRTLDISSFETSKVTATNSMFLGCKHIKNLDLSHFDTCAVENMSKMFSGCTNLEDLDISNFVTNSLTNTNYMFDNCGKLSNLKAKNNQILNTYNSRKMGD